jgi:hypothetical protein
MHYAHDHLKWLVEKQFEADDKLANLFVAIADVTADKARDLVAFYHRKKLVKFDTANARYTVKHGSYLDRDFIEYAAAHGAC